MSNNSVQCVMYRASVVMFDSDCCNIESVILSDSDYSGPHNILS